MYSSNRRDENDLLNNKQSLIDYVNTVVRSGGSGQDFVFQLPPCARVGENALGAGVYYTKAANRGIARLE
jgi:hypothetical protein